MSALPASVEQAIEWHARQRSGAFAQEDQRQFERWLSEPAHREAWEALQQRVQRTLAPLAQAGARQALAHGGQQRRAMLRGALVLGGIGSLTWLMGRPGMPLSRFGADVASRTGQRRALALTDGSRLLLDAESELDLHFTAEQRQLRLRQGRLYAAVAPQARPFVIDCAMGQLRLNSGRCVISLEKEVAHLWLLDGVAQVDAGAHRLALRAPQAARFGAGTVVALPPRPGDPLAWTHGRLEAYDQPLSWVVNQLRPYHSGVLQVAAEAGALRISGVFSLDHSDQALAALADILPLRIDRYLGCWTRINLA